MSSLLEQLREKFAELVERHALGAEPIHITARTLSPEEAIGRTSRRDFPLVVGKERLIEARFRGAIGHAYTDMPGDHSSTIEETLALDLADNRRRALFIASLNAVCRHLCPDLKTVHCKNEEPENCGREIAQELRRRFGSVRVGFIGLNPAILENLAASFEPGNIFATDLNPEAIGKRKFGVLIHDGRADTETLFEHADVVLVTGTTLGNATIDSILALCEEHDKPRIFYGVTIAAAAHLLGLERICPYAA